MNWYLRLEPSFQTIQLHPWPNHPTKTFPLFSKSLLCLHINSSSVISYIKHIFSFLLPIYLLRKSLLSSHTSYQTQKFPHHLPRTSHLLTNKLQIASMITQKKRIILIFFCDKWQHRGFKGDTVPSCVLLLVHDELFFLNFFYLFCEKKFSFSFREFFAFLCARK